MGLQPQFEMSKLAWRNVRRNWRHSIVTLLAISAGFVAVSLFDGYIRDLEWQNFDGYMNRGMMAHVIVEHEGAEEHILEDPWKYYLTKDEQTFAEEFFARQPEFVRRVRFLSTSGIASNGRNNNIFLGMGLDVQVGAEVRGKRWEWNTVAGSPLHLVDEPAVLLGRGIAALFDCEMDESREIYKKDGTFVAKNRPFKCYSGTVQLSTTTESGQLNAVDLPVVGIVDVMIRELDNRWVSLPLETVQRLLDTDKITSMTVQLKDASFAADFAKRLRDEALLKGFKVTAKPSSEHRSTQTMKGGLNVIHVFRNLFMTVVVVVAVMSVANTMMKSVNERIAEIGTLRSMGFLRRELVAMFAWEGVFLGLLATAAGLAMTVVLAGVLGWAQISYRAGVLSSPIPLRIYPSFLQWLATALLLIVLACATAWLAARRATGMVIADALRHRS